MRNPLSVIVHCADTIASSLARARIELTKMPSGAEIVVELIDSDMDAVETIILCAQHQKRIIDDVLTLSKLDSNMLLITPVEFQPLHTTKDVLKMFEGEAKKHDISMNLRVDKSYWSLNVNWARLDPSRLTQVLVNILGNAIKFTQTSSERRIVVSIGASARKPEDGNQGIAYIPVQRSADDKSENDNTAETDRSEEIFLWYSVQDTGRGLSPDEKQKLFKRFGQGEWCMLPSERPVSYPV
jgi:signal transduction histidine kinase